MILKHLLPLFITLGCLGLITQSNAQTPDAPVPVSVENSWVETLCIDTLGSMVSLRVEGAKCPCPCPGQLELWQPSDGVSIDSMKPVAIIPLNWPNIQQPHLVFLSPADIPAGWYLAKFNSFGEYGTIEKLLWIR